MQDRVVDLQRQNTFSEEIQHRKNQGSNFVGDTLSDRDNVRALI